MEAHVGFDERVDVNFRTCERGTHIPKGCLEGREGSGVGSPRGKRRGARLDHGADFGQLRQKHRARQAIMLPGHHVGVEQIPRLTRRHSRANLWLRLNQTLRRQHANGFSQGGTAGWQGRAGINGVTGANITVEDAAPEGVHDLPVQVGVGIAARD